MASTAQEIVVVYGVLIIAWGMVLGIPLAAARQSAAQAPRYLVTSHLAALMQGAMHMGFFVAFGVADLSSGVATTAACLLVVGSFLEAAGGAANWLAGTKDQFADKNLGLKLNSLSSPPALVGIVLLVVGVLRGVL